MDTSVKSTVNKSEISKINKLKVVTGEKQDFYLDHFSFESRRRHELASEVKAIIWAISVEADEKKLDLDCNRSDK